MKHRSWTDGRRRWPTHWDILSRHLDFEEAERRLRLITSLPVYYDKKGRLASYTARPEKDFEVPDDDE
jgi:hypothetical protein